MKHQVVFVVGAVVALVHCGGQTAGSNVEGVQNGDAAAGSSSGASSGISSGGSSGVSSSGGSSGGVSSSGGSSGGVSSSGGSSSGGSSSGGSSSGALDAAACLGLSTFGGGPRGVPSQHRAQATACSPAYACGMDAGGQACSTDADCASDASYNWYSKCLRGRCSIDYCLDDSDCPSTQVCSCSVVYGDKSCPRRNFCVPANCHVDADCGPGGFCSPSPGSCGSVEGYYCHKSTDPCFVPTDCGGLRVAGCVYSTAVGAFCCGQVGCSG